jgi:hypothetical protein
MDQNLSHLYIKTAKTNTLSKKKGAQAPFETSMVHRALKETQGCPKFP